MTKINANSVSIFQHGRYFQIHANPVCSLTQRILLFMQVIPLSHYYCLCQVLSEQLLHYYVISG